MSSLTMSSLLFISVLFMFSSLRPHSSCIPSLYFQPFSFPSSYSLSFVHSSWLLCFHFFSFLFDHALNLFLMSVLTSCCISLFSLRKCVPCVPESVEQLGCGISHVTNKPNDMCYSTIYDLLPRIDLIDVHVFLVTGITNASTAIRSSQGVTI